MIYFVYGNDSYRLKKTADALRKKYEDATGMNTSFFEGDFDIEAFRSDSLSLPFLADKRLIILKNVLGAKGVDGKKVSEILDNKTDSTIVLFLEEGEPDKRTALYKRLMKETVKELNILEGGQLTKWIMEETERQGGKIETMEANMLASYYGGDLWQLKNEISKLLNYDQKITKESIEELSVANINVKIFDLTDAITRKDADKAFRILNELLDSGENEMYILAMIQWQVRNLALVYDLKNSSEREVASKAKLNPYIVRKTLSAVRKIEGLDTIKKYYTQTLNAENDIKSGAKEADVSLELLINKLTVLE